MELKGIREALTRADQMEHGARPASPHGVHSASPPLDFTMAAAITSLQRQQVQQQHYHTPHLSLRSTGGIVSVDAGIHRSTGIVSSDVALLTSGGSNVDMPLSRNLEVEGGEEVQLCLIEMLQGRHPLRLQVRSSET